MLFNDNKRDEIKVPPTVMFREDLFKYKAYIHENTKNIHALKMTQVLRKMGIKNNLFVLTLFDKGLAHVDPFDFESITPNLAYRIWIECQRNHWYFFREICRIPETGGDGVPFEFHRGNLALIWCYYNDIDIGLIMPRQHGKTMGTQSIMGHQLYFQGYRFLLTMLTKDHALLTDNVGRLKEIKAGLPPYLLQESSKDKDAKEGISYEALKNTYKTFVNANNARDARKLGRGCTAPSKHIDEIAYCNYIWITFPTLMSTSDRASQDAHKRGLRCADIYTTTAGRPDTNEGKFVYDMFNRACVFNEFLYDCKDREDLLRIVQANSAKKDNRLVVATFSHLQLGKTNEWLMSAISRTNTTNPDDIDRDYLNIWKAGQGNSPIPSELLKRLTDNRRDPDFVERIKDYQFNWYVSEWESESYRLNTPLVIGMDTSEMVGQDYSSIIGIDPVDLSVVFTSRCNDGDIIELARAITTILLRFPRSVFVPEVKSTGKSIVDYVITALESQGINPWTRIYSRAVQEKHTEAFEQFSIYSESPLGINRKLFGFKTSGGTGFNSRFQLYRSTMMKALKLAAHRCFDTTLVSEFCCLTIKNGRYDHEIGGHDDMIISYLLACNLLFHGSNIQLYGLEPNQILSKVNIPTTRAEKEEQLTLEYVSKLKYRLRKIEESICSSNLSSAVKYALEREQYKIKSILLDLNQEVDDTVMTGEQLNNQLKETSNRKGLSNNNISMLSNILKI